MSVFTRLERISSYAGSNESYNKGRFGVSSYTTKKDINHHRCNKQLRG